MRLEYAISRIRRSMIVLLQKMMLDSDNQPKLTHKNNSILLFRISLWIYHSAINLPGFHIDIDED